MIYNDEQMIVNDEAVNIPAGEAVRDEQMSLHDEC